jgi:hypothetical protein
MLLRARFAHRLAAIAAAALAACGLIAAVPATAGAAGGPVPVAHWAFDEGSGTTAADSADGHTATLVGGAGWTGGIRGPSALQTNGTTAFADAPNWPTNLFGIDASRSYGSPSYWVERMFSTNLGRNVIASALGGAQGLRQVVTRTQSGGTTTFYVKLVNPTSLQHTARLSFTGVAHIDSTGTLTMLTGDPSARNALAAPDTIAPVTREVSGLSTSSRLVLPPSSVTVLRVTGA